MSCGAGAVARAAMVFWLVMVACGFVVPVGTPPWLNLVAATVVSGWMWVGLGREIRRDNLMRQERHAFVDRYCEKHGWDSDALSAEQARVISAQPEWEHLGGSEYGDAGGSA